MVSTGGVPSDSVLTLAKTRRSEDRAPPRFVNYYLTSGVINVHNSISYAVGIVLNVP